MMTEEEQKIFSYGQLSAFCNDNAVIEPPCHKDNIVALFESYERTGYSKNWEKPIERLRKDFPLIPDNELEMLVEYFDKAVHYCETVCCSLAGIYPIISGRPEGKEKEDVKRAVTACKRRYPWMDNKYLEHVAWYTVRMCNR